MPTFSIKNFGCRATQADASAIEAALLASGASRIDGPTDPDFVVLNTCTVTAAADAQARDAIRHIHRAHSDAQIIVTGCYAQRAPEEVSNLQGVSWVVGNSRQSSIPALVSKPSAARIDNSLDAVHHSDFVPLGVLANANALDFDRRKILVDSTFTPSFEPAVPPLFSPDRTRPVLKIQDGCDNRCSYCIIPAVRGGSRSLPPQDVLAALGDFAASGVREVVLSGINIGSYGRDLAPRVTLLTLLRTLLDGTSIDSIRLSSIEPMDVTEDFVRLIASSPRLAPHFHMPLQSGSDAILRAMRRWYRAAHYERRVEVIREFLPNAAIGADVIVGFPGETDEDFLESVNFIERLSFTYLHVFSFSPRPGTHAASLPLQVPLATIQRRASHLRALAAKKETAFRVSQAGRNVRALTLKKRSGAGTSQSMEREGWMPALTVNFLKIRVQGSWPANQWLNVSLPTGTELATAVAAPPAGPAAICATATV